MISTSGITLRFDLQKANRGRQGLIQASIRGEVANDEAAKAYGFRSIRLEVEVDCRTARDRIVSAVFYPDHGLAGPGVTKRFAAEWARPSPQAYLALVVKRVCPPAPMALFLGAATPDKPPAPERRPVGATVAPPLPPTADAASARPSTPKPAGWVAQIASSPRAEDAERALRALPGPLPRGVSTGVETVQVAGQIRVRAVVRGFASRADAFVYCSARTAAGHPCWARPGS